MGRQSRPGKPGDLPESKQCSGLRVKAQGDDRLRFTTSFYFSDGSGLNYSIRVMNYFVLICALLIPALLFSQEADTVVLEEVTISGALFQRFSNGANFKKVDLKVSASTLEEALADQGSVYFRTYGNQQLSTISFRGTSSYQTNVLWHGIPANYPTLGLMDFSQWPVWFMNDLSVEAGSGGALYGSGSIGGTVLVDSDIPKISPGLEAKVGFGSFGSEFYGFKGGYKTGQFSGQTNFFFSDLDNDFPYMMNGVTVRQPNASVRNGGFQQRGMLHLNRHKLFIESQITQNDREIQPSRHSLTGNSQLKTLNIREVLTDHIDWENSSLATSLAFLRNDQWFNKTERTAGNQLSLASNFWKELTEKAAFRVGININRYTASSDNYPRKFVDYQSAVFTSLEYKAAPKWKITINLRQSFYKSNAPFTPSVGTSLVVLKSETSEAKLRAAVSRGFRFPTLNDLHWRPGGNPDLRPESSYSVEGGGDFTRKNQDLTLMCSLTAYRTWSKDWIVWLPVSGAVVSPRNFRNVDLKGIESSVFVSGKYGITKPGLTLAYSYNESHTDQNGVERQMPYAPYHLLSAGGSLDVGMVRLTARTSYTSRRYVTIDNTIDQSVEAFVLTDLFVYGKLKLGNLLLVPSFQVLNLMDASYENLLNRAMPGRNYQLSLSIKL